MVITHMLCPYFFLPLEERRVKLSAFYREFLRERIGELPPNLWQRYRVFIVLVKRILEASFVNMVGDIFLSEYGRSPEIDKRFLEQVNRKRLVLLERM